MKWIDIFLKRQRTPEAPSQLPPSPGVPTPPPALVVPADSTFFHVTHWKAASQWVRGIVQELFGSAAVPPENHGQQLWERPIATGRVYTCIMIGKPEFDALSLPGKVRSFLLIRDLRDTLVSGYFSFRYSHPVLVNELARLRWVLERLDQEHGLLYLMENWLDRAAWIQRTWLGTPIPCFKFEDCIQNVPLLLGRIFHEGWGLEVKPELLKDLATRHSFTTLSGGRAPGQEELHAHYRRGLAGDWENYFTPKIARRFAGLFNDLLLPVGYETDPDWPKRVL